MSEILNGLLQKAYNLPEREVAALYKADESGNPTGEFADNALEILLKKDAERIAALQSKFKPVDTTELYNKAVKKTEGEIHAKWENDLRADYPTVDPERKLRGEELRQAVRNFKFPQEIADVKNHPDYLSMERKAQEERERLAAEYEAKIQEKEQTFLQRQQWSEIVKDIRSYFFGSGFVLPEDKVMQEAHFEDFVPKFENYRFQRNADRTILVLNPDGTRVEDPHGNPIFLHDLVLLKGRAKYPVQKQPPSGNAGNDNGGAPTVRVKFKDENDFLIQFEAEKDPVKQAALGAAWKLQEQG